MNFYDTVWKIIIFKWNRAGKLRSFGISSKSIKRHLITVHKRSCGKVMFLPVCHSVHWGRVLPLGPGVDTPWIPPLADIPWADTPTPTAAAVDGRHQTGMHSCSIMKTARKQTIFKVSLEKFFIMHHRDIANCQLQIMTILMFVTMLAG